MVEDYLVNVQYNAEHPRRLRAAVIGCGSHAIRNVFPTFQFAPVDLVAVCDRDENRARDAARVFGAGTVYADLDVMLASEQLDVLFAILSFDERGLPQYPEVVAAALEAGVNVWIEKPPASSVAEVERMIEASREAGRYVGVGFKKMFSPANDKAREITSRPEFGPICSITARYPSAIPEAEQRADDRAMIGFLDHIVHPYSVLRLLGGPIESLAFERESRGGSSLTTIRFVSGAIGSLLLSAGAPWPAPLERTEIAGQGAHVVVDNNVRVTYYPEVEGFPNGYGRVGSIHGSDSRSSIVWEPEFSLGQLYNKGLFLLGYAPEIMEFCNCMLDDAPPTRGNLEDALELMRVYEAYRKAEGSSHLILRP